jgi:hypothetical protein
MLLNPGRKPTSCFDPDGPDVKQLFGIRHTEPRTNIQDEVNVLPLDLYEAKFDFCSIKIETNPVCFAGMC